MAINYTQVAFAAETIFTRGENPTIEKVRVAIGGTGSHSTISKYLHAWRAERLAVGQYITPSMYVSPDLASQARDRVLPQKSQEMAQELERMKASFTEETTVLQHQSQAHQQLTAQLKVENERLQKKSDDNQADLLKMKIYQQKLEQDLAVLRSKNQQYEQFIQTLTAQTEQRVSELSSIYKQEIQTLTQECDALAQKNNVLAEQLQHVQADLVILQNKYEENTSLTDQLAGLKRWLQHHQGAQANQWAPNNDIILDNLHAQMIGQEAINEKIAALITLCLDKKFA